MKKLLEKNWPLLLAFIIGTIISIHYYIPSFSFDGYCNLCDSFKNYSIIFVKAGRYFPALIYYLIDLFKINYNLFSTISIILSIIFLSKTVSIIYNDISSLVDKTKITKAIIFIGAFLICFNPFISEFFVFEESFAMTLGILLSVLSASIFCKKEKGYFIKSLLILLFAAICYQSTLCMFIPYAFLLITIKNKDKNIIENIKANWKTYLLGILIYSLALGIAFVTLKIVIKIFALNSAKFGSLNILTNIKAIYRLLKEVLSYLMHFIRKEYFYGIISFILLITTPFLFINFKKNINLFIYMIIMIGLCFTMCFVPNLAMNSESNYTAARMLSSFCAAPGFLILMLFIYEFNKNDVLLKKYFSILILISGIIYSLLVCRTMFNSSKDSYERYKNDLAYLSYIENNVTDINNYENIYFVIDESVQPFYKDPINGNNYRMYFFGWAFNCGYKAFVNDKATLTQVEKNDIEKYEFIDKGKFEYYNKENDLYLILKQ